MPPFGRCVAPIRGQARPRAVRHASPPRGVRQSDFLRNISGTDRSKDSKLEPSAEAVVIRALQSSSLSRRYWYKRRRQISRSGSFILRQAHRNNWSHFDSSK